MLDSKLCLIVVLGGNVYLPFPMDLIHLLEQGGICALQMNKVGELKAALLCHRFYEVQGGYRPWGSCSPHQ